MPKASTEQKLSRMRVEKEDLTKVERAEREGRGEEEGKMMSHL